MGNHWPIVFAVLLVMLAAGYGIFQRDALEEAGQVKTTVRPLPAVYIPTPDANAPVRTTTPMATQPAAAVQVPVAAPAVANGGLGATDVNARPRTRGMAPLQTVQPTQPVQPAPQAAVQIAAQPGQLTPISPGSVRGTVFTALRAALVQKFGAPPMPAQNGGFAIAVDGVRVEVDPNSDWSVALYNNNPANAAVQTENFKSALNLAIATLEIDMTAQPTTAADGKQTLRTISKLNRVSMITDPAMGNSITIKPIQKKALVAPPNPANPNVTVLPAAPANPAQLQGVPANPTKRVFPKPDNKPADPVAPPKAPTNDQF